MIGTPDTKQQQLVRGYYEIGSGPLKLLLVGSCRSIAYLNYLARYNAQINHFTIRFVDPFNWHWTAQEELVDLEQAILACEQNPSIRAMLRETDIFVHEWYQYFGMWNCTDRGGKSIYDFGMVPRIDVCIPNFHDHFVLFQEQIQMNADGISDRIKSEGLTDGVLESMRAYGLSTLEKFYEICRKSSFPEMADHFRMNWPHIRYFWTSNHVSAQYTLYLFRQLNDRFLNLPLTGDFWNEACKEDQFCKPNTPMTRHDVSAYGLTWNAPLEELKLP